MRFFHAARETILLYGCESWTLTKAMTKSINGCYTRMLRMAQNVSWRDHSTNLQLYGNFPQLSEKINERRLRLAGHCLRHPELPAHKAIVWEPTHGRCCPGRPTKTMLKTLIEDARVGKEELFSFYLTQEKKVSSKCSKYTFVIISKVDKVTRKGLIYDLTGDYTVAFIIMAGLQTLAVVAAIWVCFIVSNHTHSNICSRHDGQVAVRAIPSVDVDSCVTCKSTQTERSHQLDIDSCVTRKSTQTERSHQLDIDSCVTCKSTQTERSHQLDIDSCVTCKSTQTERSHQLDIDSCVTRKSTQTERSHQLDIDSCVTRKSTQTGRGVFTLKKWEKNDFLLEYAGEKIEAEEAERKEKLYERKHYGSFMFYFKHAAKTLCIDATMDKQMGRFVNDAKAPFANCKALKFDKFPGGVRICLFATKDISPGTELRYDYGEPNLSWRKLVCIADTNHYKILFIF
ncbi:uncharacterized protein [Asterias amurensis]|uniref:uncharacterized protein n=1 Tax=Asterias amurensis TaxID=7602 RepID=UPI003AB4210E